MQCRAADDGAGKAHRLKAGIRCENACPADLNDDIRQLCLLLLGREFICYRPLRCADVFAEKLALGETVRLYHNTVNIIGQIVSCRAYLLYGGDYLLCRRGATDAVYDVEALTFQIFKALYMRGKLYALCRLNIENEYIEPARCRHLGIKLTERACGGVSRICK